MAARAWRCRDGASHRWASRLRFSSHGTSFVGEMWDEVASALAADYTVYALDRRGHGASHKPATDRYHFLDFADDVCAIVEKLDLSGIFGIGHSAGATDLLLAARCIPQRFSRLFVMEPTVMNPHARQADGAGIERQVHWLRAGRAAPPGRVRKCRRCVARFRAAPAFADWTEPPSGPMSGTASKNSPTAGCGCFAGRRSKRQCCGRSLKRWSRSTPEMRAAIRSFGCPRIGCPVRVATAERSWPIYKEMSSRAVALIPAASQWTFDGVGHCVAQEAPALVLEALKAFETV